MTSYSSFYRNAAWQYGLQLVKYLLPLITLPNLTLMAFAQVLVDFGFNLSGTEEIAAVGSVSDVSYATV